MVMEKPKITFYFQNKIEKRLWQTVADEAVNRGYTIEFTDNVKKKSDIGFYCSHTNYPENSKFSVIIIHGMDQGRNLWPNLWQRESWRNYDVGFLPGPAWTERWQQSSFDPSTRTKKGVYETGWPKADLIFNPRYGYENEIAKLRASLNLKYDKTVFYAPSFETDGKQEDVVKALEGCNVNVIVKHWITEYEREDFSDLFDNVAQLKKKHHEKYDYVRVLDSELSIMYCFGLCDLLITDESSVLYEASLMHVPTLAVNDWVMRTNNVDPPRSVVIPPDISYTCSRVDLQKTILDILSKGIENEVSMQKKCEHYFSHRGKSAKNIMDIVESNLSKSSTKTFQPLKPRHSIRRSLPFRRSVVAFFRIFFDIPIIRAFKSVVQKNFLVKRIIEHLRSEA